MDNEMLKYIGDQCFGNSANMVDVTNIDSPITYTDQFIITAIVQELVQKTEHEVALNALLDDIIRVVENRCDVMSEIPFFKSHQSSRKVAENAVQLRV
jgi:hypothetical protein